MRYAIVSSGERNAWKFLTGFKWTFTEVGVAQFTSYARPPSVAHDFACAAWSLRHKWLLLSCLLLLVASERLCEVRQCGCDCIKVRLVLSRQWETRLYTQFL